MVTIHYLKSSFPCFSHLTYERVYHPPKSLLIDEKHGEIQGLFVFPHYMPKKPPRWDIKQFVLQSESDSGYALKAVVYTQSGKTSFVCLPARVSLTEQIVTALLDG